VEGVRIDEPNGTSVGVHDGKKTLQWREGTPIRPEKLKSSGRARGTKQEDAGGPQA